MIKIYRGTNNRYISSKRGSETPQEHKQESEGRKPTRAQKQNSPTESHLQSKG